MKKFLKIFALILSFVIVLTAINNIFRFKYTDGVYSMRTFYRQPRNSIDVIVLGSSTAFENINPAILYEEYGIAAYDLCGSVQPIWNTYYYLKEALKSQKPKLVILDTYRIIENADYIDDSRIIKNTYGMRWSLDKVEAIKVSAPELRFLDFLIGPLQYHGRYKELDKEDFVPYLANEGHYRDWKGFYCNMRTRPQERNDISSVSKRVKLSAKAEKYYRMIFELAAVENIQILAIVAPYSSITDYQQGKYLEAERIANEYGVPFINYNLYYDAIGLDFDTDIADKTHLNYNGSSKFTKYLGKYLDEKYDLPDRRNDLNYASWLKNLKFYKESLQGRIVKNYRGLGEYIDHIPTDNCVSIITISNQRKLCGMAPSLTKKLPFINKSASPLVIVKYRNKIVYHSDQKEMLWFADFEGKDFAVNGFNGNFIINVGLDEYQKVKEGINIVTYDFFTSNIIDAVGYDMTRNLAIVR